MAISSENRAHAPDSLQAKYEALVHSGQVRDDPAQREVLSVLQALSDQLTRPMPVPAGPLLGKWFSKQAPSPASRGLYIWGNVGRGKSMLMQLFFDHVQVTKKRRVHFHAFMQEVHGRIHTLRQKGDGDPVSVLAHQLAEETSLLCFDELQATDVADATLLYRLFHGLFASGVSIVSTSNHPPATLYTGGVQKERFAKFITLLEEHMHVYALSSPSDYRHLQVASLQKVYYYPLGAAADDFITEILGQLCGDTAPKEDTLVVHGRHIHFMRYDKGVGCFYFHSLCETALGPADYLALSKRLDTVILMQIPKLSPEKRNEAKRFVTLVDALYERKVTLICTAEVPPEQIYEEGDGAFEFKRTVSRLAEMQSAAYLKG